MQLPALAPKQTATFETYGMSACALQGVPVPEPCNVWPAAAAGHTAPTAPGHEAQHGCAAGQAADGGSAHGGRVQAGGLGTTQGLHT